MYFVEQYMPHADETSLYDLKRVWQLIVFDRDKELALDYDIVVWDARQFLRGVPDVVLGEHMLKFLCCRLGSAFCFELCV